MWPHHLVVGVGETAVSVATDDASLASLLVPWRIDVPREPVDYTLELRPERSIDSGSRPLPSLRHGNCLLAVMNDPDALRTGLARVLAGFERHPRAGELRVPGVVLLRSGAAWIVPRDVAIALSARWLSSAGIELVVGEHVIVDAARGTVCILPPLGSDGEDLEVPLAGWWLLGMRPATDATPEVLAATVATAPDLLGWGDRSKRWEALVCLVARLAPEFVTIDAAELRARLAATALAPSPPSPTSTTLRS